MINVLKLIYKRQEKHDISLREFCKKHDLKYDFLYKVETGKKNFSDIDSLANYIQCIGDLTLQEVYIDEDELDHIERYKRGMKEYLEMNEESKKKNIGKLINYINWQIFKIMVYYVYKDT